MVFPLTPTKRRQETNPRFEWSSLEARLAEIDVRVRTFGLLESRGLASHGEISP